MMVDAKLVLLDEVGAGVNRTLLKDLGTAIEKLNQEKGYTFCMIEHDMDFIGRLCDPVIVMSEGSVLFEGSVEEAKKDEKVIESYLGRGSKIKDINWWHTLKEYKWLVVMEMDLILLIHAQYL